MMTYHTRGKGSYRLESSCRGRFVVVFRSRRARYRLLGIHFMSNLQANVALDVPASFKPPCKSK